MDGTTIRLVRESFAAAGAMMAATNASFVVSFYTRLFAAAPGIRGMFPDDISGQARKLEATLDFAIASLNNPDMLIEPLRDLGARHDTFGVQESHYALIADVLIETLSDACGDRWTPAHEMAWRKLLAFVAETMMEGAGRRSAA